jgi:hypothetical protein
VATGKAWTQAVSVGFEARVDDLLLGNDAIVNKGTDFWKDRHPMMNYLVVILPWPV